MSTVKPNFVKETKRKQEELEDLLVKIKESRNKMEEGMMGSIRSNVIYDKFDDVEQRINVLIKECEYTIDDYRDEEDY